MTNTQAAPIPTSTAYDANGVGHFKPASKPSDTKRREESLAIREAMVVTVPDDFSRVWK